MVQKSKAGATPYALAEALQPYRELAVALLTAWPVEEGGLLTVIRKVPTYQRYWGVELDEKGQPKDEQELVRVAQSNALVRIVDLTPV